MISNIEERYKLDRRRVEASHMQYAVLQVTSWYPEVFSAKEVLMHSSIDETLISVVSLYHGAFMARNASKLSTIPCIMILCLLSVIVYNNIITV